MDILSLAQSRYTCKAYDRTKKIPAPTLERLLEILRLTPSSINVQPWHFIVAQSDESKEKIAQAMPELHQHNAKKVKDCDSVIILAAKHIDQAHIDMMIEQEHKAGRFANDNVREARHQLCSTYIKEHQDNLQPYVDNQIYIALGQLLFAAEAEGVDSTAIGGFDNQILDDVLNLQQQGLRSVVLCTLGYHSQDDFNQQLPKARLDKQQVISFI